MQGLAISGSREFPTVQSAGAVRGRLVELAGGNQSSSPGLEWEGPSAGAQRIAGGPLILEAIDTEAPGLSSDDEAGIEAALESYRQGRVVDAKRTREIINAALVR